jgi:purine-nucleoside phosphorylase
VIIIAYRDVLDEARKYLLLSLREGGFSAPRLAVVLGSGLGAACPDLESSMEFPCSEVPGWPAGGVPGHEGSIRIGRYGEEEVLVQLGRLHYYEGLDMREVTFPISLMAELGVENIFMSNAAGALNPAYERGCLMLLRDHINLMGENPLRGMRNPDGTPAFVDVSNLYDLNEGDFLMERAQTSHWPLAEGVLVAVCGPTYETGAELRYMRLLGGDAVSMSLVPEALVAHFHGMTVTAASVITNIWDLRRPHPVSHKEVLRIAEETSPILKDVIAAWMDQAAIG